MRALGCTKNRNTHLRLTCERRARQQRRRSRTQDAAGGARWGAKAGSFASGTHVCMLDAHILAAEPLFEPCGCRASQFQIIFGE